MKKTIAAAIFIIGSFFPVFSQAPQSVLILTVRNQLEELVPGADATLTSGGKAVSTGVTDKNGTVRFAKIPSGEYQVAVAAKGFAPMVTDVLNLVPGETKKIEVTLQIMTVETKVIVGGDEAVDTEKFGGTRIIEEEQISRLPDTPEELERAIRALAGETPTGEEMPISVDGQVGAKLPPKEAIKQIRVNQNVFSAQYESPAAGGIEIFTSSNVKKFKGGAGFTFGDSRFNASDAFIGRRLPSRFKAISFNLNGPIGKRGSFFMFGSRGQNDTSVAVNARTLDTSLRPIDLKDAVETPSRDYSLFSNASYDIDKKNKFVASYSLNFSTSQNQNVGGLSLRSRANSARNAYHNVRLSETFLVNENSVVQSRFSASFFDTNSFGGDNSPAINVLESFFGGGSQSDRRTKTLNLELGSDATWQRGNYGLGFGFQLRANSISVNSTSNFGGTYTFSGRIAPVLDANGNPVPDGNGGFVTAQIDSLESYRRTLYFRGLGFTPAQVRSLGGGATQFTISGGDPRVSVRQFDAAAYVQNSYKISETLALSFGARYENQTNINSDLNLSPRIGLIWSPKSDPKKNPLFAPPRISVGYGLFFRRFELNNFVALEQASGDRSQYLITDPGILDAFPNTVPVSQLQQFALPGSKRFISGRLETPLTTILSLTASKKLPLGFSANISISYSRTSRQALTRNVNAPLAGTFNPQNPNGGVRPYGNIGNVYETTSDGRASNTRLVIGLQLPQEIVWGFINYSFVKIRNDAVAGSGSPIDPYDFSREFARDANDGVHRMSGYFSYDKLPFGLSIDGNGEASTGRRFNIITGRDTNGDGFYLERPSFATNLSKPGLVSTAYGLLDPNPSSGDRLIPRNLGRGPRVFNFDLGIGKTVRFGEDKAAKKPAKQSLYFGVRINNLFNTVNRSAPIGNMSSPNFLRSITNATSDSIVIINGVRGGASNRSLLFNVRFSFL